MEEGFILDETHGGQRQSRWVEGKPIRSFWTGLKIAKEARRLPITTYRCRRCGFLESFAPAG